MMVKLPIEYPSNGLFQFNWSRPGQPQLSVSYSEICLKDNKGVLRFVVCDEPSCRDADAHSDIQVVDVVCIRREG